MSTGDDAEEIVVVGCISYDVKTVQVSAWGLLNQTLLTNWVSSTNPSLQENPSLRADGAYIAVALWGDDGEASVPTTVLLRTGSNETLVAASSPGSMFAVDVAGACSKAAAAVCGKTFASTPTARISLRVQWILLRRLRRLTLCFSCRPARPSLRTRRGTGAMPTRGA